MSPSRFAVDAASRLPNDYYKLRFIVYFSRLRRERDKVAGTAENRWQLRKNYRLIADFGACFCSVISVVQSDAKDLLRFGERRPERNGIERSALPRRGGFRDCRQGRVTPL